MFQQLVALITTNKQRIVQYLVCSSSSLILFGAHMLVAHDIASDSQESIAHPDKRITNKEAAKCMQQESCWNIGWLGSMWTADPKTARWQPRGEESCPYNWRHHSSLNSMANSPVFPYFPFPASFWGPTATPMAATMNIPLLGLLFFPAILFSDLFFSIFCSIT